MKINVSCHENISLLIMKNHKEYTFLLPKLYPFSSLFAVTQVQHRTAIPSAGVA